MSRTVVAGIVGAAGGAALVMMGLSADLFGRVPPGPSEISAKASQVLVIDGETLRLAGVIVGLSELSVPARGEACAAGPDCGGQASAALAQLVQNQEVACRIAAHDPGGRLLARCQAGGRDVNAAMVSTGWARAGSSELAPAQSDARAHRRGIWLAG